MSIKAQRTPDARFAGLTDWPYEPRYVENLRGYDGLRMHYVDEGPKDGRGDIPVHPRRAVMGVSVSQDDSRFHRRAPARRRARHVRLRALGQAGRR
ncbi:MAG: hypothetical protein R3C42_09325 [Parvularculaceae bacterium]